MEIKKEIINIDEDNKLSQLMSIQELLQYIKMNSNSKKKEILEIKENKIEENNNIMKLFIDDFNIIKNNQLYLISFIEQLKKLLKEGINIIVPFLEICPILIKSYIESDLDEEGEELKYNEVFKLLKINSFISREYLYPIYEYFSDIIFYNMNNIEENNIEENNIKLKKFNKVFELWKIFYDLDINYNELKKINSSSYCFIGGALKVKLLQAFSLKNETFIIKLNILGDISTELNKNLILFKIDYKNNFFKFEYNQIKHLIKKKIASITLIFESNKINISIEEENNKISVGTEIFILFDYLKKFYLLDNFYGQLSSIEIIGNKQLIINEVFYPYLLSDDGFLCHKNSDKFNKKDDYIYKDDINKKISIVIENQKLVKVNYINYLDKNFDLIEYFGNLTPLIPFIKLINGIDKNPKINFISEINKKSFLMKIINDILYLLCNIINKNLIKYLNKIKKYSIFFFCLLLEIDLDLLLRNKNFIKKEQINYDKILLMCNSFDDEIINIIISKINNSSNKEEFGNKIIELEKIFLQKIETEYKEKNPIIIKSDYKQLFRHIMKELFIYNRFWSKKEFFFEDKNNKTDLKLKYKQISYYTQNYQQPLLYPILEFNEYFPKFSNFKIEKLFKHKPDKIVNYNFNLDSNMITEIINKNHPFNNQIGVKCCLVKKNYHVKGKIIIRYKNNNKYFEIIFISDSTKIKEACNKIIDNHNKNNKQNGILPNYSNEIICYGSIFPFLIKEFNRKIIIKSEDIKFILIRNYYRRTSAMEIFTYKSNKSYYFNFKNDIDLNNPNNNIIIKNIKNNEYFKKIKFQKYKFGYYNKKYENTMFPLFNKKYKEMKDKLIFYNNYDLLTIINLFSNRSFKDLYQYPIFPILYKSDNILNLNKERDLGQHIGLQELNENSIERKNVFDDVYDNLSKSNIGDENIEELCIFSTFYSNSMYTSNYLIRLFPYSLIAIELQGDGFDNPNRLFFSIKKGMENTLSQKSDLREYLPELYYLPDLFTNNNELKLGILSDRTEIDNVLIKDKKKEDFYMKYDFIANLKNYLEFGKLKLNNWIDLIFGVNQKETKDKKYYYSKDMYFHFNEKNENNIIDECIMQKFEFGIQPYQLFDDKFPELIDKSKYLEEIKEFCKKQYISEHLIIKGDKNKCFKCICSNYKNYNYLKILKKNISIKRKRHNSLLSKVIKEDKDNLIILFNYIIIGDVLGNITVYENQSENDNIKDNIEEIKKEKKEHDDSEIIYRNNSNNSINIDEDNDDKKYKQIKRISDHYKQIKYIDYNPRLNLFLSYSLDGFINIYVFPKCKLVRTIKVCNITNSNDILQKVVLVSNPFPMIFTYDKDNMYLFTLNGELIKRKELSNKNVEIYPCIDKNCGIISDCVFIRNIFGINKIKEISLPSLQEN